MDQTYTKETRWICMCDCGKTKSILSTCLVSGRTTSCGCIKTGKKAVYDTRNNDEYKIYRSMKNRCYNSNTRYYVHYGGRGITICDRWLNSFLDFYQDMGPRPSKDHSIDRIDNNGNYCPENCRWATKSEQANNKRNNHRIEYNGKIQTVTEWSKELNIDPGIIYSRLVYGWSIEDALSITPIKRNRN